MIIFSVRFFCSLFFKTEVFLSLKKYESRIIQDSRVDEIKMGFFWTKYVVWEGGNINRFTFVPRSKIKKIGRIRIKIK